MSQMNTVAALRRFIRPCFNFFFKLLFFFYYFILFFFFFLKWSPKNFLAATCSYVIPTFRPSVCEFVSLWVCEFVTQKCPKKLLFVIRIIRNAKLRKLTSIFLYISSSSSSSFSNGPQITFFLPYSTWNFFLNMVENQIFKSNSVWVCESVSLWVCESESVSFVIVLCRDNLIVCLLCRMSQKNNF